MSAVKVAVKDVTVAVAETRAWLDVLDQMARRNQPYAKPDPTRSSIGLHGTVLQVTEGVCACQVPTDKLQQPGKVRRGTETPVHRVQWSNEAESRYDTCT